MGTLLHPLALDSVLKYASVFVPWVIRVEFLSDNMVSCRLINDDCYIDARFWVGYLVMAIS
jgi:hypothetical protein